MELSSTRNQLREAEYRIQTQNEAIEEGVALLEKYETITDTLEHKIIDIKNKLETTRIELCALKKKSKVGETEQLLALNFVLSKPRSAKLNEQESVTNTSSSRLKMTG